MMKVRGVMISGELPPETHHQYPDIEEANQRILELEEKIICMQEQIEKSEKDGLIYRKDIKQLNAIIDTQAVQIAELMKINKENGDQVVLLMEEIRREKATSYYQMVSSAISTAACVITMYFGIKYNFPLLAWKKNV